MKIMLLIIGLLLLMYPFYSDYMPVDFWTALKQMLGAQNNHVYLRVVPVESNNYVILNWASFIIGLALVIYSLFYYKAKS